ncbi:MAG: HD family phosphohydrolase [Thermodesulfobacteriota bacterium]
MVKAKNEKKETIGKKADNALKNSGLYNKIANTPTIQNIIIVLLVGGIITFILSPDVQMFIQHYKVGDVGLRDIKASQDLLVEDVDSTLKKREEAKKELRSIYDYDGTIAAGLREKVRNSFSLMKGFYEEWGGFQKVIKAREKLRIKGRGKEDTTVSKVIEATPPAEFSETTLTDTDSRIIIKEIKKRQEGLKDILGFELSDKTFLTLETEGFAPSLEDAIGQILNPILKAGVVGNKEFLLTEKDKGVIVRDIQTKDERVVKVLDIFYDVEEARRVIEKKTEDLFKDREYLRAVLVEISQKLLVPNLTFNRSATEERRIKTLEEIKPVYFQVKKGEMLIREGERVTKEDLLKFQTSIQIEQGKKIPFISIGIFVLIITIFYTFYHFSSNNVRKFSSSPKEILLMGLVLISVLLLVRLGTFIGEAIATIFPFIPSAVYTYAIPVAAGAMIIRLFLNSETALVFAAVASIISGLFLENSLLFSIYFFVGGMVAAGEVRHCTQRSTIIKAGAFVGLMNLLILLSFGIIMEDSTLRETFLNLPFGLLGGVITAIVVAGVTPVIEACFGYSTNIKLLELSRMDHPLLKELALQTPGTYHHSIIIGSLVEASAEIIDANPLLAKVSAFYHDIGKMKKPQYFIENQTGEENKHERLAPSMSALILISHVKEGIELAREYKLGKEIMDIIGQHHGNSLITFFYNKAKEQEDPDVHEVKEEDFRYPGSKPQTKEAGLVMLADAVEAACKTIPNPTPAKLKGAVQKIINNIFTDGQLDECELTLRDLNEIAKSFTRVLNGIFHQRIDYPEPVYKNKEMEKGSNEGTDKKRPEKDSIRPQKVRTIGSGNIKKRKVS